MIDKIKYILNLQERVENDKLIVTCELEYKKLVSNPVIKISTYDIIDLLKEKYKIISVIKEDRICNSKRFNIGNKGEWQFKIKKPRRRRAPVKKKESTKTSFSGRIKNIATEKEKEYQKND